MKKSVLLTLGLMLLIPVFIGTPRSNFAEAAKKAADQKTPVKILLREPRESNPADESKVKKYIEDQSGIKFEVTRLKTEEEYTQRVNIALASQQDIDVIQVKYANPSFSDLLERRALLNITQSVNKYGKNLKKMLPKDLWQSVSDNQGNIWAIPEFGGVLRGSFIAIRKDWRVKLGMGPIKTFQELEAYLKAVKNIDFDNNGVKDTIPLLSFTGYDGFDNPIVSFFTDNVATGNYLDKGKITPVILHPKYQEYLRRMVQWQKEGILYRDQFAIKRNQVNDFIAADKVAAVCGWYSDHVRPWALLLKKNPEAEYEWIAPKSLSGKGYVRLITPPPGQAALGIVAYSKNADNAIKLLDWSMASPENFWTTKQGIEGQDWKWDNKDKQTVIKLKGVEKPESAFNFAFSFLVFEPWNFRASNTDWVQGQYYLAWDWMKTIKSTVNPDAYLTYNWKGTPVDAGMQDAETLIQEAKVKIILGERPIEDWDRVIRQYRGMFGDKYIELATKQYNDKMKK